LTKTGVDFRTPTTYSGKHFSDFSRHSNQCITIVSGPHQGECITAAGRYQIITFTWLCSKPFLLIEEFYADFIGLHRNEARDRVSIAHPTHVRSAIN
jgi:muramidase (phage lysozyme)